MTNYSSKIITSGLSALAAQQAQIATTSNNIANASTEGYARRRVELQARQSGAINGFSVGNGVEIARVTRLSDQYLEDLMRKTSAELERYNIEEDFLSRAEPLFKLDGEALTIGSALNGFFAAVNDLTVNPSSSELRSNFVERATDLVNVINSTFSELAELQREADSRIESEVSEINSITAQIAGLSEQIVGTERDGKVAGDERDLREQLLNRLTEKLEFDVVEQSDGSVNVNLSNGFSLVHGNSYRTLNTTTTPGFTTGSALMLDGGGPTYVTFDYSNDGSSEIDLGTTIAQGDGSLSGLLNTRGVFDSTMTSAFDPTSPIVSLASRVEAITRSLLIDVNSTYIGPDRDAGTAGYQTSSTDLTGNTPAVYGLFTFSGAADVDNNGPNSTDLTASGNQNFSSLLSLAYTDPGSVHAGRDLSGGAPAAIQFATGDASNMEALAALQSQSFSLSDGANFSETTTLEQAYNRIVNDMSARVNRARTTTSTADAKYESVVRRRDSESAVNLDEEMTAMIQYQQFYQAAARVVSLASRLFDDVLGLV